MLRRVRRTSNRYGKETVGVLQFCHVEPEQDRIGRCVRLRKAANLLETNDFVALSTAVIAGARFEGTAAGFVSRLTATPSYHGGEVGTKRKIINET